MTAHKGVDYAAPSGTPVRVVGDGTVQFAGWQNGYGKVVHVLHGRDKLTVYAHLSRVDVRKGQRVDQGQRIGAVGATGWATGPHLHFEFRIGGVHKDPRTIAKAAESIELAGKSKVRFAQVARAVGDKLDLAAASRGAPAFE
jgi:murein DD-endopeptidase MepM/ murein hydrolase activator NlpD